MPTFSPLPNDAFARQHEGRWYYVEDRMQSPSHAIKMWQFHDGQEIFLSISDGTKGAFIRGATRLDEQLTP